ncbi:hypothetical protein CPAR01_03719 [Colletotrichum paranaense]|uniref:Uncharacterized protein n=1 Tax=Colletotrichum paranaense TaxID=1914294 RepID=A0ABQ9SU99_9PEZI|nr:uncharacterized protein CPAR01_03719 [Colletotrichum paranaense]KAK1543086.1 hypothetical protein CPAR01_03719 [Colletotrichum paranaense]
MLMMGRGKVDVSGFGGWFICFFGGSIQGRGFGGRMLVRLCDLGMSSSRGGRFVNRTGVVGLGWVSRDQGPCERG